MSDNYLFQAAPKPVQTRTKKQIYREPDESKESITKTTNLMSDRRVSRGSTYAPSKRTQPILPQQHFRPVQQLAQTQSRPNQSQTLNKTRKEQQHPLPPSSAAPPEYQEVDFIRIATPEPVAGRVHCTIQTDTYLEDLRRNKHTQEHDFATQTDPENDRPTQPLFIPRSSGEDVATEIEPDALFDFELEVQAVLGVLVEKSLEQALMEVCEEEELVELAQHQATFQQQKDHALVGVQRYIQRDERRKAERERRAAQEKLRLETEKKMEERRRAATISKQLIQRMEEDILVKLEEQGYFYDPVRKEVEKVFMPYLMKQTATKLAEYQVATETVDAMVLESIREYQTQIDERALAEDEEEVRALVKYQLDPVNVPRPVKSVLSLVNKVGISEEKTARLAAHGPGALPAQASSSSGTPVDPASPSAAATMSPEERAHAIVQRILAEREAVRKAEEKRMKDIITIQSLQRGRRDRARVAKIAEKRRREAERAAMSPQELLISLRNYIGFEIKTVTTPSSTEESKESSSEFIVSKIDARGPGAQAGLVLGDRLVSVNGTPITSPENLSPVTLKSPPLSLNPGDILKLEVERRTTDGRKEIVPLELSTDEDGYDHATIRQLREESDLPASDLPWLTQEQAEDALAKLVGKLGATMAEQKGGAKLAKVSADSAASRAGLAEGDVIVSLNGAKITDHKAFTLACKELHAGDIIELEVLTPASLEKVQSGSAINLRTMTTLKRKVEMGGGGKKYSVEGVRGLRRIAGLPVFGEQ